MFLLRWCIILGLIIGGGLDRVVIVLIKVFLLIFLELFIDGDLSVFFGVELLEYFIVGSL